MRRQDVERVAYTGIVVALVATAVGIFFLAVLARIVVEVISQG